MKTRFLVALLGGALVAGPALAQSGGSGGLSGGSPGSPGAGGRAGTSSPNMGPSATTNVGPGMREGAPSPGGRAERGQRTTKRQGTAAPRRRSGG